MNRVHGPSDVIMMTEPQMGRRRRFTRAEKQRLLDAANAPGETMSSIGRRYGLSVSLLFRWRRQMVAGKAGGTSTVGVVSSASNAGHAQSVVTQLRVRVRELERLLGDLGAEVDQLRRRLMLRAEGLDAAAMLGGNLPASKARDGEA